MYHFLDLSGNESFKQQFLQQHKDDNLHMEIAKLFKIRKKSKEDVRYIFVYNESRFYSYNIKGDSEEGIVLH